jgi:pilus assembly protein CpaB
MKNARIVVLVVAVAAGGVAAYLAAGPGSPPPAPAPPPQLETVEILVAKTDIGMGHLVSAQNFDWQIWPAGASASFIRKNERPQAIEQLVGAIARRPFAAGEPIWETKFIKTNGSGFMAALLPTGMRAMSTEISPETGAGGFILPNDHVDVILSRRDHEAEKLSGTEVHTSETLLTNVPVLAIDQNIEEKNGQRVVVGKTATLALSPRQAEILALGRQRGTLSLALRSLIDSNGGPDSAPEKSVSRPLSMVRFGVAMPIAK